MWDVNDWPRDFALTSLAVLESDDLGEDAEAIRAGEIDAVGHGNAMR